MADTAGNSNRSRLNPLAMNFSPAARTSSKRKASSSAKSALSSNSATLPSNQVYISANQILGPEPATTTSRTDGAENWGDFEELEEAFFGQGARRLQNATMALQNNRLRRGQRDLQSAMGYRSSNAARRPAMLLIRTEGSGPAPYLPLHQHTPRAAKGDSETYAVLPGQTSRILNAGNAAQSPPANVTWPGNSIPVELFELIASHLARDDIKSMRLVNKDFEEKVCQSLFRTAVVPFNTELYDMIVDEKKASVRGPSAQYKGKGKMRAMDGETGTWGWRNATEDREGKVYQGHGLRVFQGFGPYIRRFGMSFEVVEAQLSHPPGKQLLDPVDSYHGTYEWPAFNYARFANLNRLEETADETSRMKSAFSNLEVVSELALSMRNGLGWLDGPDKSFRARLFQQQATVFGNSYGPKGRARNSAKEILSCLRQSVQRAVPGISLKEMALEQHALHTPLNKIHGLQGTPLADTRSWPTLDHSLASLLSRDPNRSPTAPISNGFVVLCANTELTGATKLDEVHLNPSELKKEQKEWLLETEWAQRAFLESYILAVMDNPEVFSQVTKLNLATISSGLLPMLSRDMFWVALPSLCNVIIHVSPDWRTVHKDEAGVAETKVQLPSEAVRGFYTLLRDRVSMCEHIKNLNVGWADGGENAEGMYARNSNVLPAPIALLDQSTVKHPTNLATFPHLERLTLYNCWISPPMLERLANSHADNALQKLTLESVSLTSHPQAPTQGQQAQAAAAAIANFQAQNHPVALHHPQAQAQLQQTIVQQQAAFANHFQNQMQHMQQLFNNPGPLVTNAPFPPQHAFAGPPGFPLPMMANQPATFGFLPQGPLNGPAHSPASNPTYWTENHRQGSWPDLLNKISPGPRYEDYLLAPQPWEEQRPHRPLTSLQAIELVSCGYITLDHNNTFDQAALLASLEPGHERVMTPWFRARWLALKSYMLDASSDKYLGNIVQWIPQRELDAMRYAWDLRVGWQDREKAEEAEFDGYRAGGTGRVSGVIEKDMPDMTAHLPNANTTTPPAQSSPGLSA